MTWKDIHSSMSDPKNNVESSYHYKQSELCGPLLPLALEVAWRSYTVMCHQVPRTSVSSCSVQSNKSLAQSRRLLHDHQFSFWTVQCLYVLVMTYLPEICKESLSDSKVRTFSCVLLVRTVTIVLQTALRWFLILSFVIEKWQKMWVLLLAKS